MPDFPDSGFHSTLTEQVHCLQDSLDFEKSSVEISENSVLGNSADTVKYFKDPDSEATAEEHSEGSEASSASEQDSALLQQYLTSVQQLDDAAETAEPADVAGDEERRLACPPERLGAASDGEAHGASPAVQGEVSQTPEGRKFSEAAQGQPPDLRAGVAVQPV